MATQTPTIHQPAGQPLPRRETRQDFGILLNKVLAPIASLKLTVVLFALSIAIVLFGTLAQATADIWVVIDTYFRVDFSKVWNSQFPYFHLTEFFVAVPLQIFFPPAFTRNAMEVTGWFPFPKGWLIGLVMVLNLFAAHTIRFKTQAKGSRLWIGWGVLLFGVFVTWAVIMSGSGKDVQTDYQVSWQSLWMGMQFSLVGLILTLGYGIMKADPTKKMHRALMLLGILLSAPLLVWMFWNGAEVPIDDSGMRILWQLVKGTLAGVVLLIGCMLVFKKRAGIVLLHGGIGLMMFYEVLVGVAADEGQMQITEGETVNFARDIRKMEIAISTPLNDKEDRVTVIPQDVLKSHLPSGNESGEIISHEELPFDLQIDEYYINAQLTRASGEDQKKVTEGLGKEFSPEPLSPSTGAGSSEQVDMPSVYITLFRKGTDEVISRRLLTVQAASLNEPESLTLDDTDYDLFLRFKRLYKPYSVTLNSASQTNYEGTTIPRDYSSDIVLHDDENDNNLEARIWMNNPLRYGGETFYQTNMTSVPDGPNITGLSVVTNTGWMIPYVSCMIVAVGMLAQFLMTLSRFLNRRSRDHSLTEEVVYEDEQNPASTPQLAQTSWKQKVNNWFPLALTLVVAFYLGGKMVAPRPDAQGEEMNLYSFGQIPVRDGGRLKPLDTVARNLIRELTRRDTFEDLNEKKQPPMKFLADLMTPVKTEDPETGEEIEVGTKADGYRVFRIENLEALKFLELQRRAGFLYSFREIEPHLERIQDHLQNVSAIESGDKQGEVSLMDLKLKELAGMIRAYGRVRDGFLPKDFVDIPDEEEFRTNQQVAIQKIQQIQQLRSVYPQFLARQEAPLLVPTMAMDEDYDPENPAYEGDWTYYPVSFIENKIAEFLNQTGHPLTSQFNVIREAYAENDAKRFNKAVAGYLGYLHQNTPPDVNESRITYEAYFNHTSIYYYAAVVSLVAFVAGLCSWLGWSEPLRRAAFWITVLLLVVHTYGLISRIYISGRPPVTNLYSSAIFIGWGVIALGLLLEWLYPIGIAIVISSAMSFGTLMIAQFLSIGGDTIGVLQAVLDTQFWLATHVVVVTFGYATTFVAGFLGIAYFVRGFFTPTLSKSLAKDLIRMIYGILCFSIFFSFVGTVLGGLWADDSWGRFWGWDPKENGALIIVLWNALVLHARWGGMVQDRGLACLAMGGNIATAWSWFGVNELGVGLHSYGFTDGVLYALAVFFVVQMALITVAAIIPVEQWWSFRRQKMQEAA